MKKELIAIKMMPEEKANIVAVAKKYSLPFASYCRMVILQQIKKEEKGDSA